MLFVCEIIVVMKGSPYIRKATSQAGFDLIHLHALPFLLTVCLKYVDGLQIIKHFTV
jgi:hypothetical protein